MNFFDRSVLRSALSLTLVLMAAEQTGAPTAQGFVLPYSTRTKDFSSWTPAAQGDTNTTGMAGATVALPLSISSSQNNPAGYAMTMGPLSAQINSTNYNDERLQRTGETINGSQWGFGVNPEPWGFGIAYFSPQTETGTYVAPAIGDTAKTEVSLKELRFTAARRFLNHALSLGATFEVAKAVREINDTSSNNFALSYQLGVLYRTPNHVIFGGSYAPELRIGPAGGADPQVAIPGFNRDVVRPSLTTVGVGYMPNRFFKLGISVTYAGKTDNTALLYDQNILTGTGGTFVPRLGVSYIVTEYSNFKVEVAAGSYYEFSRLNTLTDRLHATAGIEINPSFINLGAGFDIASGYHNYMVGAGIDIVRTARFFNIVPAESGEPYNGIFPRIRMDSEGLPSGLTADDHRIKYKEKGAESLGDVGKIISEVPGNVAKKFEGEKTTVEERGAPEPSLKGMMPDFSAKSRDEKAADKAAKIKHPKTKKRRSKKSAITQPKLEAPEEAKSKVFPQIH